MGTLQNTRDTRLGNIVWMISVCTGCFTVSNTGSVPLDLSYTNTQLQASLLLTTTLSCLDFSFLCKSFRIPRPITGHSNLLYRVIHKSLRDFRTRLRNNQDRHGRKGDINRLRISPSFFFVLGALAYFQVPPLRGSRDEKWRSQ